MMTVEEPVEQKSGSLAHPLSAVVLMALDALWTLPEIAVTVTGIGLVLLCLLLGGVMLAAVTAIEKGLNHKTLSEALAIGFVVAILAAVPYPIMGTGTGTLFLGYTGLQKLLGKK